MSFQGSCGPGRVASLHLHPLEPGQSMQAADSFEVIVEKGILGNRRYFCRISRSTGKPSSRQISLIEREVLGEHAVALGLMKIWPGAVRSNIETVGLDLVSLIGRQVRIGEALLFLKEPRQPCVKMDSICAGLRALMRNNRQGVLAQVVCSGRICVGDIIELCEEKNAN